MGGNRTYFRIILVSVILLFTFLLVYGPHFYYKYPYHIDEWRHISEAIKIGQGELPKNHFLLEVGFDFFLWVLSNVGFNLVLGYKYLPAVFACISSLVLFLFVYRKTSKFYIALLSMVFFASLRSNVNVTGLWFFTPLTFAIPLIFLFFWLFSEGVEKNKIKLIYWSFLVYFIILISHPVSATFMIPILIVYLIAHRKFVKTNYKLFLLFLAIPFLAFIIFFKFFWKGSLINTLNFLFSFIFFRYGWGVLEIKYNIITFYGIVAFIFAVIGTYFAYKNKKYIFVIWPLTLLFFIILFHLFNFTVLAPYQRILYYTILGLVPLSAIGLYHTLNMIKDIFRKYLPNRHGTIFSVIIRSIIFVTIFLAVFYNYYNVDKQVGLYRVIDDNSYSAVKFLQQFPKTTVLAPVDVSTAVFPISGHDILATFYFYNKVDRKIVDEVYMSGNCSKIFELARKYNGEFILSGAPMTNCGWNEVYNNGYYIYKIQ